MYSIPAPVIKTILDHCNLTTAITFARVTKRCNSIFNQYREEILMRCEYVNVTQMFNHCSDEFIITMSNHEFFDKNEVYKCCRQKRYHLYEKLGYGKLEWHKVDKKILRKIYKNNEYNNYDIGSYNIHKWIAAKLGIDLNVPYSNDAYGLEAALILRNEKMINKLQEHGSFYIYCKTGNYHLADNYEVTYTIRSINDSNDPLATFNYIEKRGHKFKDREYFRIEHYEVLKLVMSRITKINDFYIETSDFNSLMLIYDTLMNFKIIDEFFHMINNRNIDFTKYILQKYPYLIDEIGLNLISNDFIIGLLDLLDNEKVMHYACKYNCYDIIRALLKHNGLKWIQQFDYPFIKKYYS